jgi:starvation-inducible DNA-binding protein
MVSKVMKVKGDATTSCYSHLVQCLRDSMHLYQQTLLVHWGLMGSKFYQIHTLTQMIYEEMQEALDVIAEHIRSLDIATPKTVEDLTYSNLPSVPLEDCFKQEAIISRLAANQNALADRFQDLAAMAETLGDQLTLDLAVERGRAHKKFQWLLKANLDA